MFSSTSKINKRLKQIGLQTDEQEVYIISDEPKIPEFLCQANEHCAKKYETNNLEGLGIDLNDEVARLKANAEFLERLCLENVPPNNYPNCSHEGSDIFCLPSEFWCYSSSQFNNADEFLRQCDREVYQWWPATDLTCGWKGFIPAQLVFISNVFDHEFPIRKERISTGAAFGDDQKKDALINGLHEVIERDACIYSYLTRKKLPRIVSLPSELNQLVDYLRRYRIEITILNATQDIEIPTVLVIAVDHTDIGVAVSVGSRTAHTWFDAVRGAVLESIQCRRSARIFSKFEKMRNESQVNSVENRFFYWSWRERIKDLYFWLQSSECIRFSELENVHYDFEKCINIFRERKFNVFLVDLSLPEIKQFGFQTVKIVIPQLHPLYLDENAKALYSCHYGELPDYHDLKPHPIC